MGSKTATNMRRTRQKYLVLVAWFKKQVRVCIGWSWKWSWNWNWAWFCSCGRLCGDSEEGEVRIGMGTGMEGARTIRMRDTISAAESALV